MTTRTLSPGQLARQRTEDRYHAQMKRIAWTFQDPWPTAHKARNRVPLTDDQVRDNALAFDVAKVNFTDGHPVETGLAIAGDEALVFSRGAVRAAVITKVGRTNFELMYVTPTAIAQSLAKGWGIPVTRVSVRKDAVHTIRKGTR